MAAFSRAKELHTSIIAEGWFGKTLYSRFDSNMRGNVFLANVQVEKGPMPESPKPPCSIRARAKRTWSDSAQK
jgi:hypothetical protein